jgi:hypothetical protein
MHRVHGMCCCVFGAGRIAVFAAAETGCCDAAGAVARPRRHASGCGCIFFGIILYARATGHWQTNLPRAVYMDLVPHANDATHPGME